MAKKGKVYVGTSGWLYKHWRGTYYPKGTRQKDEFAYYSLFFNTVELNNPFYRLPGRETFENWRKNSKDNFMYVVKASRFITHMKKLKDTEEALNVLLHNCDGLEEKLGPILFQLPPGWQLNIERFETFLKTLPQGYRFVFEFRNATWYDESVYKLLKKYKCAFCIYQLAGHMSPIEVTADFVYVRLHGPTKNKYQGSYDFNTLSMWTQKSREWQRAGKDVYIYFDNDDSGYAAFNAQLIEMMLNKDEAITKHEADILALVISAIRQQKIIEFYYESNSEKGRRKVEPYLIAIKNKGRGDIYFMGYEHQGQSKSSDGKVEQKHYLLSKIDVDQFKITGEVFDDLKLDEEAISGESSTDRVVYRTSVRKNKTVEKVSKKIASKKEIPKKKKINAVGKKKRSVSNSKKK